MGDKCNDSEILIFATDGDNVSHPSHYKRGGHECIDLTMDLGFEYHEGSAFKHLFRAGYKIDYPDEPGRDRIEDLRKAAYYCNDKANRLERLANKRKEVDLIIMDEVSLEPLDPAEWELGGETVAEKHVIGIDMAEEGAEPVSVKVTSDQDGNTLSIEEVKNIKTLRNEEGELISVKEIVERAEATPLLKGVTLKETAERIEVLRERTKLVLPDDEGLNMDDTPLPPKKGKRKKK